MASSGAETWRKYYQGKDELATTIKKAGVAYDSDGHITALRLEAGTSCVVLPMKVYDTKPEIRITIGGRDKIVRFKIDDITKPGNKASAATSLKPQMFNVVTPTPIQLAAYKKRLLEAIEERTDLDGPLKSYLIQLSEYWGGTLLAKDKAAKLWTKLQTQLPVGDINKDFGEVLGPMAVIKHSILTGTGFEKGISSTSGIWIPARPNEPLMDYKVGDVVISAKSGKTTNTVKPSDILGLLDKSAARKRAHVDTKEYKVMQILDENPHKVGAIEATKYLLGKKYNAWLTANTALKGKYTDSDLTYECEKYISNETRTGGLNYTKLFADAIKGRVVYVKFELDATGVGKFDTIVAADIIKSATGSRPYLRSKGRGSGEKLGIQI
jgi:hypothetical protein